MKYLFLIPAFFLMICLASCHDKITLPEDAPKEALKTALDALNSDDYNTYISCVDGGEMMDSIQSKIFIQILRQHQDWLTHEKGTVASVEMIDGKMRGDTVCTVYYQYTYSDSTKEVMSQKMIRREGVWKIRLRS